MPIFFSAVMLPALLAATQANIRQMQPTTPLTALVSRETIKTNRIQFEEYRLPNGLRVILAPDSFAPVIAVNVTYDVGSRDEKPGRTGFAHLFEHMMFQGSENVGKGEHILLTTSVGGSMNGTTSQDRTNYFETLPKNQLKLGLFLEADRMRSLDISQINLDNQRAVVQEERRQSYDNRAYGQSFEALLDLAYTNFAYKHSTIGSLADLDAATLDDVRGFFATYYAPNNAVLSVVGDFDTKQAKEWIAQYFGPIPRQADPPRINPAEPSQFTAGERRKTLSDKLARQTRIQQGFVTVNGNDPDYYALLILGDILYSGRTSRLYRALIDTGIATSSGAGPSEGRGPGLFTISATLPPGKSGTAAVEAVESVMNREVMGIAEKGVTKEEVEKAILANRVSLAGSYRTALSKATALSLYAVYFNDPNRVNTLAERLSKVTTEEVQAVAKKYLTKENRSVVIVEPVK
ncbi:MAG: insulinase family protein [Fibrella sp.]|nr:insulinase family protein [Armatimonadota bacterium]